MRLQINIHLDRRLRERVDRSAKLWENPSVNRRYRLQGKYGLPRNFTAANYVLGATNADPATIGGVTLGPHLENVLNLDGTVAHKARYNFADFGSSIGNVTMHVKNKFKTCNCVCVDNRLWRLVIASKRERQYGLDRKKATKYICADLTRGSDSNERWGWLRKYRYVIYFQNMQMMGEISNSVEEIFLNHCMSGSVLISYNPMFTGDRSHRVVEKTYQMVVNHKDFSWLGNERKITVYIYLLR